LSDLTTLTLEFSAKLWIFFEPPGKAPIVLRGVEKASHRIEK